MLRSTIPSSSTLVFNRPGFNRLGFNRPGFNARGFNTQRFNIQGRRWCAALAMLFLATGAGNVQAMDFNTAQQQQHQMWQSLVVNLGDETHMRAVERNSYSDAMLSINVTPGHCTSPWLEMRSDVGQNQPLDERVNDVPADVLVDNHYTLTGRAELLTERGDSGLYVRFYGLDMQALVQQMRESDELHLRIRMSEDVEDYWFMTFSLTGAADALSRMNQLCLSFND